MRQTLSFQPVLSPYSLWLQRTQALGQQGLPGALCGVSRVVPTGQYCPEIPELSCFTALWLGRKKLLKRFHLTWGFPSELSRPPFIIMKQHSVDWAKGLSPNFLLNHHLVSAFFFFFSLGFQSPLGLLACDGQFQGSWQKCNEHTAHGPCYTNDWVRPASRNLHIALGNPTVGLQPRRNERI